MVEVPGSIPARDNILLLFFSFYFMREASDTNIANFCVLVKTPIGGAQITQRP